MELNLTYAEPTWMYDPSYNYRDQQRILLEHREMMHTIAMENHAQGATPASVKEWHTASKKFSTLS